MSNFSEVFLLFFIYSVIGWLWETFYCSFKAKKFVYRGFLIGPYCPIYGFGIVSVLYFVEPFQHNIVLLYVCSAILVTILEYLTSYVLEQLFHTTWWDYKDVPLNINGRVAIPISLFWGVACVLIVKVIQPQIMVFEKFLENKIGIVLPVILALLMIADLIDTVTNMVAFQKAMVAWSEIVESTKAELSAKKDRISEEFSERKEMVTKEFTHKKKQFSEERNDLFASLREKSEDFLKLPKINFNQRRILKGFGNLKVKNVPNMDELKAAIKEFRKK